MPREERATESGRADIQRNENRRHTDAHAARQPNPEPVMRSRSVRRDRTGDRL